MANIILGNQTSGCIQTRNDNIEICSWDVPLNTTAQVEVDCILQKVNNKNAKSSYKLTAIVRRYSDGYAYIIYGPTKIDVEENSVSMTVTLSTNETILSAITSSTDNLEYRVTCFMKIFTIGNT